MQKVNWGDKFKSFLCHYYRQVLEFDQVYRELKKDMETSVK